MPFKTILTGALLIGLAVLVSVVGDTEADTSWWVPAVFGGVLALLGIVALVSEDLRRHVMHAAALVALIMIALVLVRIITAGTDGWQAARQMLMLVIGIGFIATAIGSFRAARRSVEVDPA